MIRGVCDSLLLRHNAVEMAGPTGIEPATFEIITLAALPLSYGPFC